MATIAVIEDNDDLRMDLAEELRAAGHMVVEACDGEEGIEIVEAHLPDLIISDINMPGRNGLELLRSVRALGSQFDKTSFLFLTALSGKHSMMEGLRIGADDYLVKPVDYDMLRAKVESHLRAQSRIAEQGMAEGIADRTLGGVVTSSVGIASAFGFGLVALLGLYWFKSVLGIDVIRESHLLDLFF